MKPYRVLLNGTTESYVIPLNRIRVMEDMSSRMCGFRNIVRYIRSRGARFQLNTKDTNKFRDTDRSENWKILLDERREEIPGKDNYPGNT